MAESFEPGASTSNDYRRVANSNFRGHVNRNGHQAMATRPGYNDNASTSHNWRSNSGNSYNYGNNRNPEATKKRWGYRRRPGNSDEFKEQNHSARDNPVNLPAENINERINVENKSNQTSGKRFCDFQRPARNDQLVPVGGVNRDTNECQRDLLEEQLRKGLTECLICCEQIKIRDYIWSCKKCYNIFHLKCIKKWASSPPADKSGDLNPVRNDWRCPACQYIYTAMPSNYYCFCGKVKMPELNRYFVPHSCGEVCGRTRVQSQKTQYQCPHKCNILCHPGPCPPCEIKVNRSCCCDKTSSHIKCGLITDDLTCKNVCGRMLNCHKHKCQRVCHSGSCENCSEFLDLKCYCGKESRQEVCDSTISTLSSFSCDNKCEKLLTCRNHVCQKDCHPDLCLPCELMPQFVTTCPCRQTNLTDLTSKIRTKCTDNIATCDKICSKELICGSNNARHLCKERCHLGPCPPCNLKTVIRCRCGANSEPKECKEITTTKDTIFVCKKRCNKKLDCGRHKCLKECCTDDVHACSQTCNKKLSCGQHTCQELCHKNACHSCWNVSWDPLTCICGSSVVLPPVACGTRRPECNQPCNRRHPCDHPVLHTCHNDEACPPCTELVSKMCYKGHELRDNVSCYLDGVSCGFQCGNPMNCGMHVCQRVCHYDDCNPCQFFCTAMRKNCGHICGERCHQEVSRACPDNACKAMVEVHCPCGVRINQMPCHKLDEDKSKLPLSLLAKIKAEEGETISVKDLLAKAKENRLCRLECNDRCFIMERNRQLAEALNIKDADFSPDLEPPKYSEVLKQFTRENGPFVEGVYRQLTDLVLESKQSKMRFKTVNFSHMRSDQRHVVHELATFFGCKSHGVDQEPNRSVIVKAVTGKCYLPSVSIFDVVSKNSKSSKVESKSKASVKPEEKSEVAIDKKSESTKHEKVIDYFDFSEM